MWPHCVKRSSLHSIFALQKFHIRSLLFPFPRKPASLGFARSHTCSEQFVPRNLVASRASPLLMKKQWTYHNDKSTAFIITYRSTMQMLTIKVPKRAKRYNHITQPKTGQKNLGKSTGSGRIFSNLIWFVLPVHHRGLCSIHRFG